MRYQDFSDSELIDSIQKGSDEAVQELCRRHDQALLATVVGYLRNNGCNQPYDHGEEVKTKAWIRVIRYIRSLEDPNKLNAWRDTIARNEAKEHLKGCITEQNTSTRFDDETLLPNTHFTDYYKSRDAAIDADKMLTLAENISPDFAEIFRLYNVDQLSFDEIAAQQGKSRAYVRTVYYRGLKKLRAKIQNR